MKPFPSFHEFQRLVQAEEFRELRAVAAGARFLLEMDLKRAPRKIYADAKALSNKIGDYMAVPMDTQTEILQPTMELSRALDNPLAFPDRVAIEHYALFALLLVARSVSILRTGRQSNGHIVAVDLATRAGRAMTIAEAIREGAWFVLGYTPTKIKEHKSAGGQKAAHVRHAETRALKRDLWAWYAKHRHEFPSMDKAAEAAARKVVPVAFRTAREWIGEYKKNIRK